MTERVANEDRTMTRTELDRSRARGAALRECTALARARCTVSADARACLIRALGGERSERTDGSFRIHTCGGAVVTFARYGTGYTVVVSGPVV